LGPLPRDAVLFTGMWESFEAGAFYFQGVEGYRRDVVLVSPILLRKGWHLDALERRD
jgi:hypothetical protein